MKKSLGALLFTFLFFIPVTSQAGWYELDSGTTNTLWAIHGADENSIIAVGEDGLALYTTDGGDVWEEGVSGTTEFLNDVYMISSEVAVAVGDNHTIIKTEDGGATWSSIAYGSLTTDWYTVAMYSADDFIVAGSGSDILITDDGGASWTMRDTGHTVRFYSAEMHSTSYIYLGANSGKVIYSGDGGSTWSELSNSSTASFQGMDFEFVDRWIVSSDGYLLSQIFPSSSWSESEITVLSSGDYIYDIDFYGGDDGTIVTYDGAILVTEDSGVTWSLDEKTSYQLTGVFAGYYDERWIVTRTGEILKYDDTAPSQPTNLAIESGSPTSDSTPTFTWTASTDSAAGIEFYQIKIDSADYKNAGNVTNYSWADALSDGNHTVYARAVDEAGNMSDPAELTFEVDTSSLDTTGPSVSLISTIATTVNVATDLTVSASDSASDVASCEAYIESVSIGSMSDNSDGTFTLAYTFTVSGTYSAYAVCEDSLGNSTTGSTSSITIGSGSSTDTTAPTVGSITPTSAVSDESTEFSASISDDVGVSACYLYKDDKNSGVMGISAGTASIDFTFYTTGTYTVYVGCTDSAGNIGYGDASTISVTSSSSGSTDDGSTDDGSTGSHSDDSSLPYVGDISDIEPNSLIKIFCVNSTSVNDSCRAVYFFDEDGYRHAFPNEKVFFTWYDDFDDIILTSIQAMADAPLGKNVTYHPGVRMVKFQTVNTVYAVEQGGVLRAIASETVAKNLYGVDWNKKIDDISDAFFGNYTFGADIDFALDYDIDDAKASVSSLADNF